MKKPISLITTLAIIITITSMFPRPYIIAEDDKPFLPLRLMITDTKTWKFRQSGIIRVDGNGTYEAKIDKIPSLTAIANLSLRMDGANFDWPHEFDGAPLASMDWWGASVAFENVRLNDVSVGNTFGVKNLVSQWGESAGRISANLWQAWWEPDQYLTDVAVTEEEISGDTPRSFGLPDGEPITSITLDIVIDGIGGELPPPIPAREHGVIPENLTAAQLTQNMGTGWNLGNTFDSYVSDLDLPAGYAMNTNILQLEMLWVSGTRNIVTQRLIDGLYDAGFDILRIPVTWYKVADPNNNWKIREEWLDRIQQVVNMAYNKGMYVIINSHHDEYIFRLNEDASIGEAVVTALWGQIAERFRDYDERLIFESMNEPHARTNEWDVRGEWDWNGNAEMYETVNQWNQAFINAVRATGGNNLRRIVMVPTFAANGSAKRLNAFRTPADPENGVNKIIMSIHPYEPYGFTIDSSTANWSEQGVRNVLGAIAARGEELGISVILGEWGVTNNDKIKPDTEQARTAARARYAEFYVKEATALNMRAVIWDNGESPDRIGAESSGFIDRETGQPHFPEITSAITRGRGTRYIRGRVLGNDKPVSIFDALEILKFLVNMPDNAISTDKTGRAAAAALISDPTAPEPTIFDALEILKYLVNMPDCAIDERVLYKDAASIVSQIRK